MPKIVAIGGGNIGGFGCPVETTEIDRRIVELTGKSRPQVLFLPTASGDSDTYPPVFESHFSGTLGCKTDTLLLIAKRPSAQEIEEKILGSDAIYVGGGNTAMMMRLWRKLGIDVILREAWEKGIVLSGLSAGAICWFRYGSSDSRRFTNPEADLIRVSCMELVNATYCPHFDVEADRRPRLKEMMKRASGVALAFDNCCAIEIIDDSYRILSCREGANAYRIYWSGNTCCEEVIPCEETHHPLAGLIGKPRGLRSSGGSAIRAET